MFEVGSLVAINNHYLRVVGSNNFIAAYNLLGYGEVCGYNELTKTYRINAKGEENIFDGDFIYPLMEKEQISNLTINNRIELFLEFMEERG